MNTVGLVESTRVSSFQWCHIYVNPTLFRDPSVQKHQFRQGQNNTFALTVHIKSLETSFKSLSANFPPVDGPDMESPPSTLSQSSSSKPHDRIPSGGSTCVWTLRQAVALPLTSNMCVWFLCMLTQTRTTECCWSLTPREGSRQDHAGQGCFLSSSWSSTSSSEWSPEVRGRGWTPCVQTDKMEEEERERGRRHQRRNESRSDAQKTCCREKVESLVLRWEKGSAPLQQEDEIWIRNQVIRFAVLVQVYVKDRALSFKYRLKKSAWWKVTQVL